MTGFVNCPICGKRLIERKKDGMLYFCFGKTAGLDVIPVEIRIYGSIAIKCIRKSCNKWSTFNTFEV